MSDIPLIDSHAHMDMKQFDEDLDTVIQSARKAGVQKILTVALSIPGAQKTLHICRQYPDLFLAALGIHPHDAQKITDKTLDQIASTLSSQPFFVALGEIGLDYYRDLSPREDQKRLFRAQIRLARELNLPVLIHCRDAHADTLSIMTEEGVSRIGGVMHCFSGDKAFARNCLKLNLIISFAGPLTYKNSTTLKHVCHETPLDRILTETDCPYLAPVPHRGERNEPAFVAAVTHTIAEIKKISSQEAASQIAANFNQLFKQKSSVK
ncbi:MAG: TatD family hydrolase [bacterium]